jgi:hypothetical protein
MSILAPSFKRNNNEIFCKFSSLFGIYGTMPLAFTDLIMRYNPSMIEILDSIFFKRLINKSPININNFFHFFPSPNVDYVFTIKYLDKTEYNTLGLCKLKNTIIGNRIVYKKKNNKLNRNKNVLGLMKLG